MKIDISKIKKYLSKLKQILVNYLATYGHHIMASSGNVYAVHTMHIPDQALSGPTKFPTISNIGQFLEKILTPQILSV